MVFKRRDKLSWHQRLRESFLPRKGWKRGITYMGYRVKRIPDTPHRIALGVASGVFVGFSPFFGLHMLASATIAYLLRANILAAVLATWVNNPLTLPLIIGGSLQIGRRLIGQTGPKAEPESVMSAFENAGHVVWNYIQSWFGGEPASLTGLMPFFHHIFLPYLVGSSIFGLAAGAFFYFLTRPAITAFQHRRRTVMAHKRAERARAISDADTAAKDD